MEQFQPLVALVGIDDEFIVDRNNPLRRILSHGVKADLDAIKLEVQHGRNPFDALDHASRNGRQQQLGRVEGIGRTRQPSIHPDLGYRGAGQAGPGINPARRNPVFQHVGFPVR